MAKRVPPKDMLEREYMETLSVRKVAARHGLSHSAVWRRIGPVLGKKSAVRLQLADIPDGMSLREWARVNGVSPSTVSYWRRKRWLNSQ